MPRPAPYRLALATYPVRATVRPRYQDLDPMGHLNNVAYAAMFEDARVRFNHVVGHTGAGRKGGKLRAVVAANTINYLAEGSYPAEVEIGSGIGRIGNRSWEIHAVMHQSGHAIATCDTVLVMTNPVDGGIPDNFRERLHTHLLSSGDG